MENMLQQDNLDDIKIPYLKLKDNRKYEFIFKSKTNYAGKV